MLTCLNEKYSVQHPVYVPTSCGKIKMLSNIFLLYFGEPSRTRTIIAMLRQKISTLWCEYSLDLNSLTVHISRLYTKRGEIGHSKYAQHRCGVGGLQQLHSTTRTLFCSSGIEQPLEFNEIPPPIDNWVLQRRFGIHFDKMPAERIERRTGQVAQ